MPPPSSKVIHQPKNPSRLVTPYSRDSWAYVYVLPIATYDPQADEKLPLVPQKSYAIARGKIYYNVDLERNAFAVLHDINGLENDKKACTFNAGTLLTDLAIFLLAVAGVLLGVANLVLLDHALFSDPDGRAETYILHFGGGSIVFSGLFLAGLLIPWAKGMPYRLALRNSCLATGLALLVATVLTQWLAWACYFFGWLPAPQLTAWMKAAREMMDAAGAKGV
ncbi:hypothetical protein LTR36_006621 [Oleoguttula mirabilis]|uniref:Intimal thickness related receptor IRP domain-containing protein n=1 Tax=Oleoguttula mirabilis TaxID=1507867 RepID=A0AAV9JCR4_9PEZI|nr:hypothetical protein LTR36_006621 [Oleoguttula mirabilis]